MKAAYRSPFRFLCVLTLFICSAISGCGLPPAEITNRSGDKVLAQILDSLRIKANQSALAAAVIFDGEIQAAAAVGTRKLGTTNWVSTDDRFIIGSCGKAFSATLAALMVEEGKLNWACS